MFHLVALGLLFGAGAGSQPKDVSDPDDFKIPERIRHDYNHLRMPAHGTVYQGMLYGFFDDDWAHRNKDGLGRGNLELQGIPLDQTAKSNWKPYPFQLSGYNCRHHIGYGALWFSNSTSFLNRWDFHRIQEIADSFLRPTDALGRNMIISGIPLFKLMGKSPKEKTEAFDSVPISKNGCTTFLLIKKQKKFEIWDSQGAVYQNPGGFKTATEVKNFRTFDSSFTEDFYAFVRKNDYYFVTESGKLYHAPPPKEGEKNRTMKALWTDAKRPIVAVIEDADNDKVWLFAKDKTAGAKLDVYFEMKPTIRTESFDPKKLRPVNLEGRAKTILEYLPLITPARGKGPKNG